ESALPFGLPETLRFGVVDVEIPEELFVSGPRSKVANARRELRNRVGKERPSVPCVRRTTPAVGEPVRSVRSVRWDGRVGPNDVANRARRIVALAVPGRRIAARRKLGREDRRLRELLHEI